MALSAKRWRNTATKRLPMIFPGWDGRLGKNHSLYNQVYIDKGVGQNQREVKKERRR
jgi:hypothetical protein